MLSSRDNYKSVVGGFLEESKQWHFQNIAQGTDWDFGKHSQRLPKVLSLNM